MNSWMMLFITWLGTTTLGRRRRRLTGNNILGKERFRLYGRPSYTTFKGFMWWVGLFE